MSWALLSQDSLFLHSSPWVARPAACRGGRHRLRGQGRELGAADRAGAPRVVVIDEVLAQRYWPAGDAVGARLELRFGAEPIPVEIVGVVGEVKHGALHDPPTATLYAPIAQVPNDQASFLANGLSLVVRCSGDPSLLAEQVRHETGRVDPEVAASPTRSMEQHLAASLAPRRFQLLLLGAFAVVALLLATMGIYASTTYAVRVRTAEIGLRLALGATAMGVVGSVVKAASRAILVGWTVGLIGALSLSRVVESLLFGVDRGDPVVLAGVSVLLLAVALGAAYVPARRASRLEPVAALRSTFSG